MTVTITNGGNGSLVFTFSKTAPNAKMQSIALQAAQYLFDHGYGDHGTPEAPRTFESLSNAERLAILDQYIANTLRDTARTKYISVAVDTARADAERTGDFEL